eukprot:scaffold113698_cov64-Phaeocystis_antarctica.AAC.3
MMRGSSSILRAGTPTAGRAFATSARHARLAVGEQRAEHSVRRALAEKTEQVLRRQHGLWVPRAHQLGHGRLQQDVHEVLRPERGLGAAGHLRRAPEHQCAMHSTEPTTTEVLHSQRDELFRLGGAEANQGLAYLLAHTLVRVARGAEQHLNAGYARCHRGFFCERFRPEKEARARALCAAARRGIFYPLPPSEQHDNSATWVSPITRRPTTSTTRARRCAFP